MTWRTLRLFLVPRKIEAKCKRKKKEGKEKEKIEGNKNRVKSNILFLFVISDPFYLFKFINIKIK